MSNTSLPTQDDLPSIKQLTRSSLIALLVASTLMVTIVLPAEFGKDPTGVGTLLGLTAMGHIKQSLAKEAASETQHTQKAESKVVPESTDTANTSEALRKDQMSVSLKPDQATEIKLTMQGGQKVIYKWVSTGQTTFDTHGDSSAMNIDYHSYGKGSKTSDTGVLVAKFAGNHGWYWRNRTSQPITITLKTQGSYSQIKQMD